MEFEEKERVPVRYSFLLWVGLFILTLVFSIFIASMNERITLASLPWSIEENYESEKYQSFE